MTKDLGLGVGAGLVSALLFGMLLKATPLAIVLYVLAPLPILIVGLGWSHRAALAALVSGSVALAIAVSPYLAVAFAAYLAVPACWLAYLALLGRPTPDGTLEWYPLGRLLAWIAGTAALAFVAIAVIASPDYETFRSQITAMSRKVIQVQTQGRTAAPAPGHPAPDKRESPSDQASPLADDSRSAPDAGAGDAPSEVADALAAIAPALAAQGLTLLLVFYLWSAARIVQVSGRLLRPWPDIPATMMPRAVLGVLAVSLALSLGGGYVGVLGTALTGALSAVFALQGLAAFHDRSRGRPGRAALLIGLYVILFVTQGFALFALTVFGIADTALARRRPDGLRGR